MRYYDSRGAYFACIRGIQHKLSVGPKDEPNGPCYAAAVQEFGRLHCLDRAATDADNVPLAAFCERYLQQHEDGWQPKTLASNASLLNRVCHVLGHVHVSKLTFAVLSDCMGAMQEGKHVIKGMRQSRPWGRSTCRAAMSALRAAFRWGIAEGGLSVNPLAGRKLPSSRKRVLEALIDASTHQALLAATRDPCLQAVLQALCDSAARPNEILQATARDWRDDIGAIVYNGDDIRREDAFRHKTAGHGTERVIYLHGPSLALIKARIRAGWTGRLWLTKYGRPWTLKHLDLRFRTLREKIGKPLLVPYGYRHQFATDWIASGRSVDILAQVMGNSAETVRRYYSHVRPRTNPVETALREFAEAR